MRPLLRTPPFVALLLAWAPSGFTRDSRKEALVAEGGSSEKDSPAPLHADRLLGAVGVRTAALEQLPHEPRTHASRSHAPPSGVERWVDDAEGAGAEDTAEKVAGTNGSPDRRDRPRRRGIRSSPPRADAHG